MRSPFIRRRHGHSAFAHVSVSLAAFISVVAIGATVLFIAFLKEGPVLERGRLKFRQSIDIVDRKGKTLYRFSSGEHRLFLPGNTIPDHVKKALIAIEDERFLVRHLCVDARAILRALKSTTIDSRLQGASTITQQLVRLLYLTPERTVRRKLYEILLSCRLEFMLTKEEILTLYLNGVSFGSGISGIEAASQAYFGVPTEKLSLAQAAALVSIPQRPSYYSPYGPNLRSSIQASTLRALRNGELPEEDLDAESIITGLLPKTIRTKSGRTVLPGRASAVLKNMARLRFIENEELLKASNELLTLKFDALKHPISAPHFSLWIRSEVEELLETLNGRMQWESTGVTVRTTLDPTLQNLAENVIDAHREMLTKAGAKNIALVAVDRVTRQVLAYVGNVDFFEADTEGQIDMALVPRQPGSSIKPLIYATAFEHGFGPNSIVMDSRLKIGNETPRNYEGGYRGAMTIRDALARSRNIPAIRVFLDIGGEETVLEKAYKVGLRTPIGYKLYMQQENPKFNYGWPLAIGSIEVPLVEMMELYSTIANHGVYKPLKFLCSLHGRDGKMLLTLPDPEGDQAIEVQAADGVDGILRDSSLRPTGVWRSMLEVANTEAAAKTGTSNLCFERDVFGRCTEYGVNNVWTMGYTDELVVGVWVGNADNSVMDPLADGLTVAAPIWKTFLENATRLKGPERASCPL